MALPPESDPSRAMLASAKLPTADWLNQALPFASPLNLFNAANRPSVDLPIGHPVSTARIVRQAASLPKPWLADHLHSATTSTSWQLVEPMPHAFASSLLPMTALQATNVETARVEPHYRTGGSGEDLFSGNYNWSLPIVSLPGRAGHDLNLTLVYNSLVWTKAGGQIRFDQDYGWPSPGFRFGFPVFLRPLCQQRNEPSGLCCHHPFGRSYRDAKGRRL